MEKGTPKNQPSYSHDHRLTRLELTIENIDKALIRMENRFDTLEHKLDNVELKLGNKLGDIDKKFDGRFDSLNNRIWYNFYWMIAGFVGLLGVLAHGFKWL